MKIEMDNNTSGVLQIGLIVLGIVVVKMTKYRNRTSADQSVSAGI